MSAGRPKDTQWNRWVTVYADRCEDADVVKIIDVIRPALEAECYLITAKKTTRREFIDFCKAEIAGEFTGNPKPRPWELKAINRLYDVLEPAKNGLARAGRRRRNAERREDEREAARLETAKTS